MGLDAGSVYATLGGRFSNAGFHAFGSAMYKARAEMDATEKRSALMAQRTSQNLEKLGHAAKVTAGAGIIALGAIIAGSVKKAADFEQQLSALGAVSNATAGQMRQLRTSAMQAGAATKFSALDAAKAQTELAKGGLSVTQILRGGLKGALALAAAGELDLADAAAYTVNAMKLFKLGGDQATHVADALATAANQTTADVQDFGMALVQGGGAARSAGFDFNQTITLLEAMAEVGVKNSDAGTSMKTALLQLIGPTKQQAEASKKAGLSFLDQSGQMKSLTAISAMLRSKTEDMTKAQRTALFQTLAGTDGFRTLLALYDAGPDKLRSLEQGLERQGTAAEVAAKKQDNLKGKLENLKGSIETAGIAIGTKLLPGLTSLAEQGTQKLNQLLAGGQVDAFAASVKGDLQELGQIVGDVAPMVGRLAAAFIDLGHAVGLGDAGRVEAMLAALVAFKAVSFVGPIIATVASRLGLFFGLLRTAVAGGEVATLVGLFAGMANPLTAIAGVAAAAAAAFVLLSRGENEAAAAARAIAESHRDAKRAIDDAMGKERTAAQAGLDAKQATLDHKQAVADLAAARRQYGKDSPQYEQALLREQQAALRSGAAHREYDSKLQALRRTNEDAVRDAKKKVDATNQTIAALQKQRDLESKPITTPSGRQISRQPAKETLTALADQQKVLTEQTKDYVQVLARSQVSETSRQRLMHASTQITRENALGISNLIRALDGVPKEKQTKLLLYGDQSALARLGNLISTVRSAPKQAAIRAILTGDEPVKVKIRAITALVNGVPRQTVAHILATTSGESSVRALQAAINAVRGKQVTVAVNTVNTIATRIIQSPLGGGAGRRAQGRGPIGRETALVGEGRVAREHIIDPRTGTAMVVDRPTLMDLPDSAYVIPTDPAMKGRAIDLLRDLAKDLGISAFAPGRKPKKRASSKAPSAAHRWTPHKIPAALDPISLPVDDFKAKRDAHLRALDQAKQKVHDLPGTIAEDRKRVKDISGRAAKSDASKQKKARDLKAARDKLRRDQESLKANRAKEKRERAEFRTLDKAWRDAKDFQAKIDKQTQEAEAARAQMDAANKKHDEAAFQAARTRRKKALDALDTLLKQAKAHADPDSPYGRKLDQSIAENDSAIADTDQDVSPAEQAAQDLADTGFTPEEEAALKAIEKDLALASLTADLGDDREATGRKVGLLEQVLAEVIASPQTRGGDEAIASIASQLKSARDDLAALSGTPGASNDNPDVQAQIEQANQRAAAAAEEARINSVALQTFLGGGDIGSGGPNAFAGGGGVNVTQNFSMMAPPSDPDVLRNLGDAAAAGVGFQTSRRTTTTRVG